MQKLTPVKVLSIRQPWAWLIVNGYKAVENRRWNTQHRGHTLIHASKTMTKQEWQDAVDVVNQSGVTDLLQLMEHEKPFILDQRGGIVGEAMLRGTVHRLEKHLLANKDKPWFFGEYGFVFDSQRVLPFTPLKGRLGFFNHYIDDSQSFAAP